MLISQDKKELAAAGEIQRRAELNGISLIACDARAYGLEEDFDDSFRLTFSHETAADFSSGRLIATPKFNFEAVTDADPPKPAFSVNCTFRLSYVIADGYEPSTEEMEAFKKGNVVFNSWPYVREFVHAMANRMGFTPPPMPLLRIVPKPTEKPQAPSVVDPE